MNAYDVTVDPRTPRDEIVAVFRAAGMPTAYAEANANLCVAYTEKNPDDLTGRLRFRRGESASDGLVTAQGIEPRKVGS